MAPGSRVRAETRPPSTQGPEASRSWVAGSLAGRPGGDVGIERDSPGLFLEPEDQGHGKRAGREGDDDAGDHHRLRHGIEGEAGRRSPARDDAEHKKDPAADQIEGENLAKRLRIDDETVEPEPDQRRPYESRQRRRAHGSGLRRGGPATSIGSVTAIVSSMKASMKRMIGLAKPAG